MLLKATGVGQYKVVYVGMAGGPNAGMRAWVTRHTRKFKKVVWTHFPLFEVCDNIAEAEGRELEGLLRHIFLLVAYAGDARPGPGVITPSACSLTE